MTIQWSDAAGAAKRVYENEVKVAQPYISILKEDAPFNGSLKPSSEGYRLGVLLSPPNSVLYAGSSPVKTSMNTARPMVIDQAVALGYEMDVFEETPWVTFSRLSNEGESAIDEYFLLLETAMLRVGNTRHEISLLAGQTSLGTVESLAGSATTSVVCLITAATWRGGLFWALGPNATLDAFTSTTKNNGTGALVLNGVSQAAERTILMTAAANPYSGEIAIGDTLWLEGTWSGTAFYDMPGLVAQASNTTGTSMGLSATTYPNWAGNTDTVGGPLTSDVLETFLGKLRNRAQEGDLTVYMPETVWRQIFSEVMGLRYIPEGSSKSQTIGQEQLKYMSARFGGTELKTHSILGDQSCLILKKAACCRVGSRDVDFGVPIRLGGSPNSPQAGVLQVTSYNTGQSFVTADVGVLNREPGCSYFLTGITN